MTEMGARRRRAPLFGAVGAEKGGKWKRAAGALHNFIGAAGAKNWGLCIANVLRTVDPQTMGQPCGRDSWPIWGGLHEP